jgi:arylsulfatase A-like enzyme
LHLARDADDQRIATYFGFNHSFLFEDWKKLAADWISYDEYFGILRTSKWYGDFVDRTKHHEDVITTKAVSYLESAQKPFFVMVGYSGPHPPYAAPREFVKLYDPKAMRPAGGKTINGVSLTPEDWRKIKLNYFGCISWIDDNIGRLLRSISDDVIVIFMSDHGDILGDHHLFSKGIYGYEGVCRTPLLMRLPSVEPGEYKHIVQHIDILPTLLHITGIRRGTGIQGLSLANHLKTGRKLNNYALSMVGQSPRMRMMRTGRHKYWIYGKDERLYEMRGGVKESNNLVKKRPDLLDQMRFRLLRALIDAEDPIPAQVPR